MAEGVAKQEDAGGEDRPACVSLVFFPTRRCRLLLSGRDDAFLRQVRRRRMGRLVDINC
jgi:hypothetical protein